MNLTSCDDYVILNLLGLLIAFVRKHNQCWHSMNNKDNIPVSTAVSPKRKAININTHMS